MYKKQYLLFSDSKNKEKIDYVTENKLLIYEDFKNINFCNNNEYLLENIVWIYDNNNYRIPYYDNIKIQFIKLSNNANIFDYISSCSIIPQIDIISGEKIMSLADIFIGTNTCLIANPNTDKYIYKKIDINLTNDISTYNIIFIKTDDINLFYNKFDFNNKIILTHNSDLEINTQYIKNIDKCKKQLSQNCLIKHSKLISLPIGLPNSQWKNYELIEEIRIKTNTVKDKNIYFYFSLNTHLSRTECYDKLKNKLEWNKKLSKDDYFMELKRHKYAICPRGMGLDTHRLWECFYLDVIPIMLKKDSINIDNLPIIFVDDWNDLDINNLEFKFKNIHLSLITMNYYKRIVTDNYV